jgi:hypothetical protein
MLFGWLPASIARILATHAMTRMRICGFAAPYAGMSPGASGSTCLSPPSFAKQAPQAAEKVHTNPRGINVTRAIDAHQFRITCEYYTAHATLR